MTSSEEILDLVDKDDNVIGTIVRDDKNWPSPDVDGYLRAAQCFQLNSEGKIYVPIRTATKTIAPNGFDYTAGGHIDAGEDYIPAMIREAKEELNIDLVPTDLELISKSIEESIRYINALYLIRRDETPALNPDDFVSGEWLTPNELIDSIDAGHPTKTSLRHSAQLLQDHLQHL
jgi:isopentenyldiphosphate isomerase